MNRRDLLKFGTAAASAAQAQQQRPRIAIGQIMHESNSFNPAPTGLADFLRRNESIAELRKQKDEVAGFLEGCERYQLDPYVTLLTHAVPKGPVTAEALDALTAELIGRLRKAPKFEGVLLALHGAMVTEKYPHGDAEIMRRVREALGTALPIVVTHDFHANVSPEIVRLTTALLTYKQNPHVDTFERGVQAARIMAGAVTGKVKPAQAIAKPPMIYNSRYQNTSVPPWRPILDETRKLEEDPKILAASANAGYQYGDVPQTGPSVVVVTDNDPARAEREARRISDMIWATRGKLVIDLPEPAEAVRQARASDKAPVILVEMGDNIGGGSAGDATFILAELLRQKAQGWVAILAEPQSAQSAAKAGIGGAFDSLVGGKIDKLHGEPVRVRGKVKSLHDGKWVEPEIRHGGRRYYDQGLTAVIEAEGSTADLQNLLMLTTLRQVPFSLHQLISCGVYPQRQKMIVVKAAIAYRAAYEPIAGQIIEVDTPGTTAINPKRFQYTKARRPLFGL
jgi:microcystin degradation protein MlrC